MLGLVHNFDEKRLPKVRESILSLKTCLDLNHFVTVMESTKQKSKSLGLLRLVLKYLMYFNIEQRVLTSDKNAWQRLKSTIKLTKKEVRRYFNLSKRERLKLRQKHYIHYQITKKHVNLWKQAKKHQCDALLVFEDDVVFNADSNQKLELFIELLSGDKKRIFVDLAGGFSELKHMQEEYYQDGIIRVIPPTSNTACAYFYNVNAVNDLIKIVTRKPYLKLLSIDWLMNELFIRHLKSEIISLHTRPTVLTHGSMNKAYQSWMSKDEG